MYTFHNTPVLESHLLKEDTINVSAPGTSVQFHFSKT